MEEEEEAWVQLYIKGEDESGGPFPIEFQRLPKKRRICDLAEAVYGKMVQVLPHCGAPHLVVYKAGTDFPPKEVEKLEPDMPVPQDTTAKNPLRVVAPASARARARQQPAQQGKSHETLNEIQKASMEIRKAWCQPLPAVPLLHDLETVVKSPLPKAIPTRFESILDLPFDDVLSYTNGNVNLTPDLETIRSAIYLLPRLGTTEHTLHTRIELLVLRIIVLMGEEQGCNFQVDRNENGTDFSGATIRNQRPDVLVWLPSGVLAFKGEDKAKETERQIARAELLSKLNDFTNTFFGSIPYQLCYVAAGNMLQFMAINRFTGGRPALVDISDQVDLTTVRGRSLCVRYAVNIARILFSLEENFPEGSVAKLGDKIETDNTKVDIFGEYVIKQTNIYTNINVLKDLYADIERSRPPFLASLTEKLKVRGVTLVLHITPVGFCGKLPGSIEETKHAGRCVLAALSWLHTNRWVHRDIRPPNIMYADGKWYLVDLEWANRIDSVIGNYNLNNDYLPPELGGAEQGFWTAACDMWQFGKLLEFWNHLDASSRSYIRTQTSGTPTDRLSASECCGHPFFAIEDGG